MPLPAGLLKCSTFAPFPQARREHAWCISGLPASLQLLPPHSHHSWTYLQKLRAEFAGLDWGRNHASFFLVTREFPLATRLAAGDWLGGGT